MEQPALLCCFQGKEHLEAHLLPQGMKAVPVERLCWINGRIDCGAAGIVSVENSKTDYLLLMQEGCFLLDVGPVTEALAEQLLPYIIGFYEVGVQEPGVEGVRAVGTELLASNMLQIVQEQNWLWGFGISCLCLVRCPHFSGQDAIFAE